MTNNPNAAAGRRYDDAEIDRFLADYDQALAAAELRGWRMPGGPPEAINVAIPIIRQLRAERDAARAEIEMMKRGVKPYCPVCGRNDVISGGFDGPWAFCDRCQWRWDTHNIDSRSAKVNLGNILDNLSDTGTEPNEPSIEASLDQMAADPDIQREIRQSKDE